MIEHTTNLAEAEYAQAQPDFDDGSPRWIFGLILIGCAAWLGWGALCFEIGRRWA